MNYISEIKAFYDMLEANPMPSSAIALWHALMSIANGAMWPERITPSISTLQSKSGIGKDAIGDARNLLKQRGLIDWKSRGGNQSATYKLFSLVSDKPTQTSSQTSSQSSSQSSSQYPPQSSSIYKLNETKLNNNDDNNDACENVFGEVVGYFMDKIQSTPSAIAIAGLKDYAETMNADVIKHAMDKALDAKAANWKYINKILLNWQKAGIKTMADVERERQEWERRRTDGTGRGNNTESSGDDGIDWDSLTTRL